MRSLLGNIAGGQGILARTLGLFLLGVRCGRGGTVLSRPSPLIGTDGTGQAVQAATALTGMTRIGRSTEQCVRGMEEGLEGLAL